MGVNQNPAKTLIETVWGTNFFDSLPPKWKSSLKMKRYKTPGVSNGTLPDEIGEIDIDNLLEEIVATSQVTTGRTNELEKITEKIQVALLLTTTLQGQDFDEQFNLPIPYTEHLAIRGAEIGDDRKYITPINSVLSEVRTVDISAFDEVLSTYKLVFPSTVNIDVPDFLTGITIMLETNLAGGTASGNVSTVRWSSDHSVTIPVTASVQASAVIAGEVIPHMVPFYGIRRTVQNYLFYMPAPVTSAAITARLEQLTDLTVTNWSDFKPGYVTIVLVSTRQSARSARGLSFHDSSSSGGSNTARVVTNNQEQSLEGGITIKTVRLPATLHGNILLVDEGGQPVDVTQQITSDAAATTGEVLFPNGEGILAGTTTTTATAVLRIIASGLSATEGATSLPDNGLLIVDVDAAPFKYGYVRVLAKVIDASTLA